jgi:hypothetical protein
VSDEPRTPWVPRRIPAPGRHRPAAPGVDRREWTAWTPPAKERLAAVQSELATLGRARHVRDLTPAEENYEQHLVTREQEILEEIATRRPQPAASIRRRLA